MVDVEGLVPAGPLGEFLDGAGADGAGVVRSAAQPAKASSHRTGAMRPMLVSIEAFGSRRPGLAPVPA